jgi:acyl-CoA thioesterase-2
MPNSRPNFQQFIDCELIDVDLYRGQSQDFQTGQVYGGQVFGQAIKAAYGTVDEDRFLRSAHAYFLRRGDVNAPIIYEVDRSMDGKSVSSRRVVAKQHGKQIFHLSASFQINDERGFEWQETVDLPTHLICQDRESNSDRIRTLQNGYMEVLGLEPSERLDSNALQMWMRVQKGLAQDRRLHESILAYMSDFGILYASAIPLGLEEELRFATKSDILHVSIDHAIWFHRPFNLDDWIFYDCRSVSSSNGRAYGTGRLYNVQGDLIASTAQEGVLRRFS